MKWNKNKKQKFVAVGKVIKGMEGTKREKGKKEKKKKNFVESFVKERKRNKK